MEPMSVARFVLGFIRFSPERVTKQVLVFIEVFCRIEYSVHCRL
jgi:hypothetical protein